ncbi:MAG: DUF6899 family protein [Pseudonocardiaceae bacterium]
MPYIVPERRFEAADAPATEGELNFAITTLVDDYIRRHPAGLRYAVLNEVVGALECAKLELYRRIVGPYEDKAIAKNGDVYLCDKAEVQS